MPSTLKCLKVIFKRTKEQTLLSQGFTDFFKHFDNFLDQRHVDILNFPRSSASGLIKNLVAAFLQVSN